MPEASETYTVVAEGPPVPWKVGHRGSANPLRRNYDQAIAASREYQLSIQVAAINQHGKIMLEGPIQIVVAVYKPLPKKYKDLRVEAVKETGDNTNYLKNVEDALQGIFYRNDSQVVRSMASKHMAVDGKPRTIITVRQLTEGEYDGA
jgi:Holliday junction resolvase RusA-like endonuclease